MSNVIADVALVPEK